MIKYDFTNKRILVVGASSGIGASTAELIAESGGEVILLARNEAKLKEQSERINGAKYYVSDVSDVPNIGKSIANIVKECGPLDGYVHSAGIGTVRPLNLCNYDYMKNMMDTNFFSFVEITRTVTKKRCFNPGMSIVAISSVSSLQGNQSKTGYCASKAALDGAIRCMAKELASKNIRINSVMPGITRTRIFDQIMDNGEDSEDLKGILTRQYLGICEPFNIASAVCFLLSEEAQYISGTALSIDAGRLTS